MIASPSQDAREENARKFLQEMKNIFDIFKSSRDEINCTKTKRFNKQITQELEEEFDGNSWAGNLWKLLFSSDFNFNLTNFNYRDSSSVQLSCAQTWN